MLFNTLKIRKVIISENNFVWINFFLQFCTMASTLNIVDQSKPVKDWKFELNSGQLMPVVGFGTAGITTYEEIKAALDYALGAGYRHFDTAQIYKNEEIIGTALKELLPKHNLTRKDLFLTSKLDPNSHSPDAGYKAVKESLKKLQTDYLDLYLIHHPAAFGPNQPKGDQNKINRIARWKELVKAKKEGLVKDIGVSNFAVKHLKQLLENDSGVKPVVNQIKWDPHNQPRDILEFCKKENILVEAYSSLGGGRDPVTIRDDPVVKKIAEKLGKTSTQVLLRWPIQEGIAVIPKSKSKKHIEENLALDFVLPEEDVKTLNGFEQKINRRLEDTD